MILIFFSNDIDNMGQIPEPHQKYAPTHDFEVLGARITEYSIAYCPFIFKNHVTMQKVVESFQFNQSACHTVPLMEVVPPPKNTGMAAPRFFGPKLFCGHFHVFQWEPPRTTGSESQSPERSHQLFWILKIKLLPCLNFSNAKA